MPKIDIEISPLTFAKIIDWASSNTEREIGGYLIGKIIDEKILVTDAIYATADSNPTFVSFDNMLQFKIIEELEKKGRDYTILGWYHTHPGLGCFLSGTDIATQKIYQALLPEAIAMVCDGNTYAKTRNQKDFKAQFYRVDKNDKSQEINFGVLTNPNKLLELLTDFIQNEENVENIVTSTVLKLSGQMKNSMEILAEEKLVSKNEFVNTEKSLKKGLASVRTDFEELKAVIATKEEINDLEKKHLNTFEIQRKINFILIFVSILNLVLISILLILFVLP